MTVQKWLVQWRPVTCPLLLELGIEYTQSGNGRFLTPFNTLSKANVYNYGHQYTIEGVQSFTFLRRTIESCKNISNYCHKTVSFALLNRRNVTKTSFDHPWAGKDGSCLRVLGREWKGLGYSSGLGWYSRLQWGGPSPSASWAENTIIKAWTQ